MPGGDGGERGDGTQAAEEEEHPTHDDDDYKRATICVSSQVGCAVNCQFCLTAKLGMRRNLTPGEIAGQVAAVLNRHVVQVGKDRINLVFMGMGEPFLNYDAFMAAVRLLVQQMGIPESRMTVSTSGIEPAIRRFALEPIRPKLALSLNASNDTIREAIMPITRKWDIAALLEAVRSIPLGKREYVTFEYVLLGGVNDQPEHAEEVLALLKGMPAKVNLIVWNPGPGVAYQQPSQESADRFHKLLVEGGIPAGEGHLFDHELRKAYRDGEFPLSFNVSNIQPSGANSVTADVAVNGPKIPAPVTKNLTFINQGDWALSQDSATQLVEAATASDDR